MMYILHYKNKVVDTEKTQIYTLPHMMWKVKRHIKVYVYVYIHIICMYVCGCQFIPLLYTHIYTCTHRHRVILE